MLEIETKAVRLASDGDVQKWFHGTDSAIRDVC